MKLFNERGYIFIAFALLLPLFILFMSLVLELGRGFTRQTELQNIADAAALAGVGQIEHSENEIAVLVTDFPENTSETKPSDDNIKKANEAAEKSIQINDSKSVINSNQIEKKLTKTDKGYYYCVKIQDYVPLVLARMFLPDTFMPEGADPIKAAKAMATILMTLRGTPFIYEGQELGYTNVAWKSIDCYNDISSIDQYKWALRDGCSEAEALKFVHKFSRDNARTPMQWTSEVNAGFSTGKPWLPVHDDYLKVNAEVEDKDPDSVLNYYRKLNEIRQKYPALIQGDYTELLVNDESIYAFVREFEGKKIYKKNIHRGQLHDARY